MAVVEQLLRGEENGSLSFGNHTLETKSKVEDFQHGGDIYKVKTYKDITKLEKNGMFAYESVPGTSVIGYTEDENGVSFVVEGNEDAQITVGLQDETEYEVYIAGESVGKMTTNLGGKLSLSVELAGAGEVQVKVIQ
ncbi:MAG: endosialidase [Lachnospiraceae bacterium]|nr:endosialidase [Lachnospiraceae bacterium]MBR3683633.1 endosialidase [Lachnospiraceae bacterium]